MPPQTRMDQVENFFTEWQLGYAGHGSRDRPSNTTLPPMRGPAEGSMFACRGGKRTKATGLISFALTALEAAL
jgi:hypothetical protein